MDYKQKEFSELMFAVHIVPDNKDLLKQFAILESYDEFHVDVTPLETNKVIRYIVYAFDRNTPLPDDIIQRRIEAASLAGFNKRNNKFRKEVEEVIRGENANVNNMIIAYASIQANEDWMMYISYQESLRKQLTELHNGDSGEKTKDLITNTQNLQKAIAAVRKKMFKDDKDTLLKKDLYRYAEAQRLKIRPEDYAKRLGQL